MRDTTTNPHPTESRSRGPKKLRPHSTNFAVPDSLRPLADALEANSVLVDRGAVVADLRKLQAAPVDSRGPELSALLHLADRCLDGDMRVESLAISARSHAFLDLTGGAAWQVQNRYLLPGPDTTLVTVYGQTTPFRMLAHLSDDINLTAAAGSGDAYDWFAVRAGVPRRLAKVAMLKVLLAQRDPQVLVPEAREVADELTTTVPGAVLAVVTALKHYFGTAYDYMADRAQYDASPHLSVQQATNRVGNAALVHAHAILSQKNTAVPVITGGPCEVIYEVSNDRLDDLELRLHRESISREGIHMPIHADVLARG